MESKPIDQRILDMVGVLQVICEDSYFRGVAIDQLQALAAVEKEKLDKVRDLDSMCDKLVGFIRGFSPRWTEVRASRGVDEKGNPKFEITLR